MKNLLFLIVFTIGIVFLGCGEDKKPESVSKDKPPVETMSSEEKRISEETKKQDDQKAYEQKLDSYCHFNDSGVVAYFSCTGKTFTNALTRFLTKHPNLEVLTVVAEDELWEGYKAGGSFTHGYTVVFKKSQK